MTCYRGTVTLNGRTTLELVVFRNPRGRTRLTKWYLYRTTNGSKDNFTTPEEAMAWGSKLNPKIVWTKSTDDGSEFVR